MSVSDLSVRRRRSRLLYYILLGYSRSEIVRLVAKGFGVSERTVRRDIGRLDQWVGSVLSLEYSKREALKRVREEFRGLRGVLYGMLDDAGYGYTGLYVLKMVSKIFDYEVKLMELSGITEIIRRNQEALREEEIRNKIQVLFRDLIEKPENTDERDVNTF